MKASHPPAITTDLLLALALPLLSALAGLLGYTLLQDSTFRSNSLQAAAIYLVITCAIAILLWWFSGLASILWVISRNRDRHQLVLPAWAPALLKRIAIASLGASLFVSPAHAAEADLPATSISQPQEAPAAPLPFFPPAETINSPESTQVSPQPTDLTETSLPVSLTIASKQSHQVLPFFMGATRALPPAPTEHTEPSPLPRPAAATASTIYTVQEGDSLWSIAQSRLGTQASDQEILLYAQDLFQSNQEAIGAIENPIFTGQRLDLPVLPQH